MCGVLILWNKFLAATESYPTYRLQFSGCVVEESVNFMFMYTHVLVFLQVSVVQSPLLENAFCVVERGMNEPYRLCTKYVRLPLLASIIFLLTHH